MTMETKTETQCPACEGKGYIELAFSREDPCKTCGGAGVSANTDAAITGSRVPALSGETDPRSLDVFRNDESDVVEYRMWCLAEDYRSLAIQHIHHRSDCYRTLHASECSCGLSERISELDDERDALAALIRTREPGPTDDESVRREVDIRTRLEIHRQHGATEAEMNHYEEHLRRLEVSSAAQRERLRVELRFTPSYKCDGGDS